MKVLFLSDPLFTKYEHEMLARLAVGLADDGIGISWSVPESLATRMSGSLLVPIFAHQERRLGLSVKQRARNLCEQIEEKTGALPDIVHLFGGSAARLAAEVVRLTGAVPAFELWRPHLETATRATINQALGPPAAHAGEPSARTALITVPTDSISQRVVDLFPEAVVRKIRWGVHTQTESAAADSDTTCMLLVGPGRDSRAWLAAFRAALRVLQRHERFFLFADAGVTHRLRAWKYARAAGVLDQLSLVDEAALNRDLLLGTDVLLYSDARGESRSVLIQAMASGVAVIAAADPLADSLIDGRTARLVADTTETQWVEAIEHVAGDTAMRRRLVDSAMEYAQSEHRATRQIISLIDAYECVAGEPIRIGPSGAPVLGHGGG